MAFVTKKDFMVVSVEEITSKKGTKFNVIHLLDWEGGQTTEFMDFDQKYSNLKARDSVVAVIKVDNTKDGWKVYLNSLEPVKADAKAE